MPVAFYCELMTETDALPAFVTSLSEHGLYLDSLAMLGGRSTDRIQLQLTLPGEPEALWVMGEVIHDEPGRLFNETAIRFVSMAKSHWRVLRRWVRVRELALTTQPSRMSHGHAA